MPSALLINAEGIGVNELVRFVGFGHFRLSWQAVVALAQLALHILVLV